MISYAWEIILKNSNVIYLCMWLLALAGSEGRDYSNAGNLRGMSSANM